MHRFYLNIYLYIKAAKSLFNVRREKLSPRPLTAEAGQFRGFRGQGVHNIFCTSENL
jgi:hypothetical protein